MNKTIIININGIVFHIEEDAYEILKSYMTDVQRHFLNSADSLEITTDIENRIAEMFNEILLREGKQVVVEQDVKTVVEQMGSVEDFEIEEDGAKPHAQQAFNYGSEHRRLFRDPDDHLVAGVCSGIANYFDFNPVWVRLLFAITVAFAGTGAILYAILWIVVPKAVTRADRMAMKGQKLDLQGFKTNFEEELNTVKGHLHNFQNEARPFVYKTRDFAGDVFSHFGNFLGGAGRVMGKLVAIALIASAFAGIIALVVLVISAFAYGNRNMGIYHMFPFNIADQHINNIFIVCATLMGIIPLLAIILTLIHYVFRGNVINRTAGSALLMTWIIALSIVIYYTAKTSADFKEYASFSQTINIKPSADSTYYLKLNDIKFLTKEDSVRLRVKEDFGNRVILDDDNDNNMDMPDKNISIYVEKSDVKQPVLVESFSARGSDYQEALYNARGTNYQFKQEGNVLKFNRRLEKQIDRLWRAQRLHLTLRIPLNSKVVIDGRVERFVRDISVHDCNEINKKENAVAAIFVMTDNGLQCKVDTVVIPQTPQQKAVADSVAKANANQ
ncbi:PspC domain-containing protein [Mucilaginibacter sp. RB4R14]|uniref:PspC domain-containing protein n=1 Tax=Mucilaginibacter aurantiaciroseus TaxID=2949308 RepID=UPI002090F4C8|nr:PspC domain-containing protein [Mucilaginibacter aurantiaciroseus]MCO5936685.1 PspC domain-containing protein [Mucilaginibacter aurantiaciroseus]